MLILNSPSNPLGAVLGEELTRSLVALAVRHDLWIISDECYEAFTYDVPHVSPARFDSDVPGEARVFTSLTLSKTYGLTGLRIGALICPPGLEQKMNNVMEAIVSCVASPSQYAALAALTGPQDYVSHAHAHYRANRDAASAVLASKGIPFLTAQGAFYLWADVSHVSGGDVRSWVRRFLADSGVSFAPGTAFGSIGEGWIRIALCSSQADLVEGLGRLPGPAAGSALSTPGDLTGPLSPTAAGPATPNLSAARALRVRPGTCLPGLVFPGSVREVHMWWQDLLWGIWNGLTAWIVLIVHVFGQWSEFPFYNTARAGNWYDFGFLLGVGSPFLGGLGARGARSRSR